jgi:hypothetical protein
MSMLAKHAKVYFICAGGCHVLRRLKLIQNVFVKKKYQ